MFDKLKDILPGIMTSLIISLVTTLVIFSGTFSALRAEVTQNSEALKSKVGDSEYRAILNGQNQYNLNVEKRLDRIESKIDRIGERLK